MRRVVLYSFLFVAVLGAISARFLIPGDIPIIKDIVYTAGDANEPALALDIALPPGKGPFPLVNLHSWRRLAQRHKVQLPRAVENFCSPRFCRSNY